MALLGFLEKTITSKTPTSIKVIVIIQLWFFVGPVISKVTQGMYPVGPDLVVLILFVLGLIAIWNLRRWGLLAVASLTVVWFFSVWLAGARPFVLGTGLAMRIALLVPVIRHWKLMTW